jgi:multiple sugar transport system ATP-binding protein
MIELRNVSKIYGQSTIALRNLNLQIQDKEFFVVYGPAGAGKSTTMRIIAGITRPSQGDILRDGVSILDVAPENRNMAMAFENYALYSHMSVYENLAFPLKASKYSKKDIEERVQQVARILQITELLDRRPGFLSGGQRQRVSLGRAIVRPSSLYLLDEPIGHLDAKLRHRMRAELKAMAVDMNATVALVTTASREALALGDRIAILRDGILEQVGTPEEIYSLPQNEFVASFVGEPPMSFLDVEPVQSDGSVSLRIIGSDISLPITQRVAQSLDGSKSGFRLGVRAKELSITSQPDDKHHTPGSVYVVEPLGYCNIISVKVGDGVIRVVVDPTLRPEVKETIWLSLDSENIHLFHGERAVVHPVRSQKVELNNNIHA